MKWWLIGLMMVPGVVFGQQRHGDGIDDVLQYTPYAAVVALKACGVESRDDWKGLAVKATASFVVSAGIGYVMKNTINEWRPDGSDKKSMPSGHAIVAFSGATVLHHEFGDVSPWISVAGFGVATFTAVDRVVKDRHHWYDVAAGAAIGIAASELSFWVSKKILKKKKKNFVVGVNGNCVDLAVLF